ncbi:DUF1328 domain-containing protein [Rubrivivax gelatinosus]|uniref:DUF1328 domain-containing protein n=1 Tax=Rubrivivax gelatinosus TaxID=28068 RepID=UPI00190546A9|nr:DUF1328 domain-containing protein [Rubrivivax gelatinosus]
MLHCAAALLAIALLAAVFGIGGLADGLLGAGQVLVFVAVGAALASLLARLADR